MAKTVFWLGARYMYVLPRDTMRKRGFADALCPSVCPFVMLVHYIHTTEDIVKLLCRPGSPIILVFDFDPQRRYPIPRGTLSAGA